MRIFKTKHFSKWAQKNLVNDAILQKTATEISEGLFEANLGGCVLKNIYSRSASFLGVLTCSFSPGKDFESCQY